MLSYGTVLILCGALNLVWYVWGYAMGQRDQKRKQRK